MLDKQQREAVIACEDAQLVLAAAGSGKTMSLLAKIKYIVCKLHILPSRVLVISFTKKTVAELKERCEIDDISIRTFHSLGLNILKNAGIKKRPIDDLEKQNFLRASIGRCDPKYRSITGGDKTELLRLVQTFLSLHKESRINIRQLEKVFMSNADESFRKRAGLFLELYRSVRDDYDSYLGQTNQLDFADMINLASDLVRNSPRNLVNFEYILLDEVQDLSRSRQRLICEILRRNPSCRLFAVGDDWQSIYRFAGSDLELIRNFEKLFERRTRQSFIETTHRFGKPTTKLSSSFVQQNRLQICKKVRTSKRSKTPINIVFSEESDSDAAAVERVIESLGAEYLKGKTVQIISRYNSDIARLMSPNFKIKQKANQNYEIIWRDKLHFEFCSMHKSKGITRDIVIVLNMSSRKNGMPASRPTDPLIEALLAPAEKFAFAEERRLFYVAITRAREQTFLVADAKKPSLFILEMNEELAELYDKSPR